MEEIYISRYGTVMVGKKPKNYMKRWTVEEDKILLEKWFQKQISVHDIAELLGRSYTSIHKRICLLAMKELNKNNESIEKIAEKFHLSIDDLEIDKVEPEEKTLSLLKDIRQILLYIAKNKDVK